MGSISPALMILFLGDVLTLVLTTLVGFSSHGTLDTAGSRILATFFPSLVAWLLVAPLLGAYDLDRTLQLPQLWRPFWAMVLSAPMAALLRGLWLNAPILPVFVIVLGGINALSILAWRSLYCLGANRLEGTHG
jgi:hypothetical protein